MSHPLPGVSDSYTTLRRRWWEKFAGVNQKYEKEIRSILTEAARHADDSMNALATATTFSASVRTAQIRLAKKEIQSELTDIFSQIIPILKKGDKDAAGVAADGLTDTDRHYLRAAFSETDAVDAYVKSQRASAMLGVQHAITRITKTDQPLSTRVYKTRSLANRWVQRDVTIGIIRGDSAKEISNTVRRHIRPDTPGGVSYAAMRLARTELNNAFHATTIALSQDRPWIESMAWNLSNAHEPSGTIPPEICEIYSKQTFHVDLVPPKPHPQCRCFVTPVLEDIASFEAHLTAGMYRDWIRNEQAA